MKFPLRVFLCITFSTLIPCAWQVSVSLYDGATHPHSSITCLNLLPGQCCFAPSGRWVLRNARVAAFDGLAAHHIAAVWSRRSQIGRSPTNVGGCSGTVLASQTGPGTWTWRGARSPSTEDTITHLADTGATGASYIEMPLGLPPDSRMSGWLAAEGILGLVWGGGKWFASPEAGRLLSGGSGVTPKRLLRRGIRSENKGTVYATEPTRSVFPTFIVVNGTKYTDIGGMVYESESGIVLNLTGSQT